MGPSGFYLPILLTPYLVWRVSSRRQHCLSICLSLFRTRSHRGGHVSRVLCYGLLGFACLVAAVAAVAAPDLTYGARRRGEGRRIKSSKRNVGSARDHQNPSPFFFLLCFYFSGSRFRLLTTPPLSERINGAVCF